MVYEYDSKVIVMMTGLVEKGRRKCAKYWPEEEDEADTYGEIQASLPGRWPLRPLSLLGS